MAGDIKACWWGAEVTWGRGGSGAEVSEFPFVLTIFNAGGFKCAAWWQNLFMSYAT